MNHAAGALFTDQSSRTGEPSQFRISVRLAVGESITEESAKRRRSVSASHYCESGLDRLFFKKPRAQSIFPLFKCRQTLLYLSAFGYDSIQHCFNVGFHNGQV